MDYLNVDKIITAYAVTSDRRIDLSGYRGCYFTTQLPSENINLCKQTQSHATYLFAQI